MINIIFTGCLCILLQDNSVHHFIYTLGQPDNDTLDNLARVADQNNLKLENSSGIKAEPWPQVCSFYIIVKF
jgi:hypothetical protein